MTISPSEVEIALDALKQEPYDPAVFPFRFLEAHDLPKSTISRSRALAAEASDGAAIFIPRKFQFKHADGDPGEELKKMRSQAPSKTAARFLLTTDGVTVSGYDRQTDEAWHDSFDRLNEHFNMTLPLAGIERYKSVDENPADIKAAGRLAKFYDAILENNKEWQTDEYRHALNLFMTRVLFCMFAEDTGIIKDELFTKTLDENTRVDGTDVDVVLERVFEAMDVRVPRRGFPAFVTDYPYVNGGLFRDRTAIPRFSKKSRRILIDACQLDWAEINPDIFGSMIQGVVDPDKRGELGMHYTSVPNIMKLIGPLFLDDMQSEFAAAGRNAKKLQALLNRIYNLRIFDPACGSGNFLIIAYRELRRLEMAVLQRLQELPGQAMLPMSQVRLGQFYGIEYTDFATETAKLSMWIAEHQSNKEFRSTFGSAPPDLPLRDSGNIVRGNALQVDWTSICNPTPATEVFIVGNPPYVGSTKTSAEQKEDMRRVFDGEDTTVGKIDYVGGWYQKAAVYCARHGAQAAFVATNSICQGEQVSALWPGILKRNVEIGFARTSFKWANNAAKNAAVICIIVGIRPRSDAPKKLFAGDNFRIVANISPYLIPGPDTVVYPKASSPSGFAMEYGSKATDDGNFFITADEKTQFVSEFPEAERYLKRVYGSDEFLNDMERWVLWLEEEELAAALSIPGIKARVDLVEQFRLDSKKASTRSKALVPHKFEQVRYTASDHVIIVPSVYSENRNYLPCGILSNAPVITNLAFGIYDGPMWMLAVLLSRLHAVWAETVCGRIKSDVRYSNKLGFNQFPLIELSDRQKEALAEAAWRIIELRESHHGRSVAQLYNERSMPEDLLAAHKDLDVIIEKMYKGRGFTDDLERILHLLNLYAARQTRDRNVELVDA